MFNNYATKKECYDFLRSVGLATNNGKVFYHRGIYELKYGEFSPCEYVVKYRKQINGVSMYGVYLKSYYFRDVNTTKNPFRFLDDDDISRLSENFPF